MLRREDEMKEWLLYEVSQGDVNCETIIRKLLLSDKVLVKKINHLFNQNELYDIKKLIKNHISSNKIIIRTCKHCGGNMLFHQKI